MIGIAPAEVGRPLCRPRSSGRGRWRIRIMYLMSWSGGKDSCLACYKAIQQGLKVSHIVNFISAEYKRVSFHGTPAELVRLQSEAMGIPLLQKEVQPDDYEPAFKQAVKTLIPTGIKGMVFGDIYLQEHRQWVTRVCREMGIEAIEPLGGMRTEDILDEFIKSGFEAIIVSARAVDKHSAYGIDKDWIGHRIDLDFINYLKQHKPYIDLCGEGGEYHTFVVNGPLFNKPVDIIRKEVIEKVTPYGKWYFLDIKPR
ncbi:MAG: diphthine--ammonia ligase [Planctomycetota bacterium]